MATAPIRPLTWESAYAAGAAQEMAKRQKKQNKTKAKNIRRLQGLGPPPPLDVLLAALVWAGGLRRTLPEPGGFFREEIPILSPKDAHSERLPQG